jgi:predicted dehydrogenase
VKLVAMSDAFQDRLDEAYDRLSKMFDSSKVDVPDTMKFVGFGSYKQAIDEADVVILATPPGFRPEHFEYAINNGKHVFMEKPVATDVAGVKRVIAAAKQAKEKKLNVVVGLQRQYQGSYRAAFDRKDQLGKIVSGQVYWNSGGVWVRERQDGWTEMEYQMRNWYYFNWLCGDHILEQHIHNIDVANWFIGEYPVKAQGMGGREVRNGPDHGQIFDHHFVEFEYPSGAIVSSQCRHQRGCMNKVSEMFQGTNASLYTTGGRAVMNDYSGNNLYTHNDEMDGNPYQIEHDELFTAIRQGGLISDGMNGAMSTMSAILGRMATYSGKVVSMEEAMNAEHVLVPEETSLTWSSTPPAVRDAEGNYPIPVPGVTKFW